MRLDRTTGKPRRQRIFDFPRIRRFETGVHPTQREWRREASSRDATAPGTSVTSPPPGELQQVHARERRLAQSGPGGESRPSATLERQRGRGNSGRTTGSRSTSRSLQRSPEPAPNTCETPTRHGSAARLRNSLCALDIQPRDDRRIGQEAITPVRGHSFARLPRSRICPPPTGRSCSPADPCGRCCSPCRSSTPDRDSPAPRRTDTPPRSSRYGDGRSGSGSQQHLASIKSIAAQPNRTHHCHRPRSGGGTAAPGRAAGNPRGYPARTATDSAPNQPARSTHHPRSATRRS